LKSLWRYGSVSIQVGHWWAYKWVCWGVYLDLLCWAVFALFSYCFSGRLLCFDCFNSCGVRELLGWVYNFGWYEKSMAFQEVYLHLWSQFFYQIGLLYAIVVCSYNWCSYNWWALTDLIFVLSLKQIMSVLESSCRCEFFFSLKIVALVIFYKARFW